MLKRALVGLVVFGGILLWHFGRNGLMPTLAQEALLAPPAQATSVSFKSGAWACTSEEFKLQVLDHRYYANPVVIKIIGGAPEFCREINARHDYALLAHAPGNMAYASPCPDHSCVAFNAHVAVNGEEADWVLYAPNSFIASSR